MKTLRELLTLAMLAAVVGWSPAVSAKTPPSQIPVLDSPRYWDEHLLAYAKVKTDPQGNHPKLLILEEFSARPQWKPGEIVEITGATIEPRDPFNEYASPKLENIDYVFVATEVFEGGKRMAVWRPKSEEMPQLRESCRVIREIRAAKDLAAGLVWAVKAGDPIAERYALHALKVTNLSKAEAETIALAKGLRADRGADIQTRMAAADLLNKAAADRGDKSDDWAWIAETLRTEKALEFEAMRQLVIRLHAKHHDERLRTIDFICELASDLKGPTRRRAALLMSSGIEGTIGGDGPSDAGNVKITECARSRLADPSPMVRIAAAYALWQTSNRLRQFAGQAELVPMLKKTVEVLDKAVENETVDLQLQGHLIHYQTMIKEMAEK